MRQTSVTTVHRHQAWYVYCVLPADGDPPPGEGVLPAAPVTALRLEHLTVLASLVPRAPFNTQNAANRLADPDWMAARLAAHQAVISAVTAKARCLPLAFGALFSTRDQVHHWLAPRAAALRAALARVAGQTEWALSMQVDAIALTLWLKHEDPPRKPQAPGIGNGSARRLDHTRATADQDHVDAAAADVAARLADAGLQLLGESPQAGLPSWAVLVPNRLPRPNLIVQALDHDLALSGLSLRRSGPRPAYAFARAALERAVVHG